jgi:hypothetical protein
MSGNSPGRSQPILSSLPAIVIRPHIHPSADARLKI